MTPFPSLLAPLSRQVASDALSTSRTASEETGDFDRIVLLISEDAPDQTLSSGAPEEDANVAEVELSGEPGILAPEVDDVSQYMATDAVDPSTIEGSVGGPLAAISSDSDTITARGTEPGGPNTPVSLAIPSLDVRERGVDQESFAKDNSQLVAGTQPRRAGFEVAPKTDVSRPTLDRPVDAPGSRRAQPDAPPRERPIGFANAQSEKHVTPTAIRSQTASIMQPNGSEPGPVRASRQPAMPDRQDIRMPASPLPMQRLVQDDGPLVTATAGGQPRSDGTDMTLQRALPMQTVRPQARPHLDQMQPIRHVQPFEAAENRADLLQKIEPERQTVPERLAAPDPRVSPIPSVIIPTVSAGVVSAPPPANPMSDVATRIVTALEDGREMSSQRMGPDASWQGTQMQTQPQQVPARPVLVQIAQHLPQTAQATVDITLNPEELGRVRMTLASVEGVMTLSVTAERIETLELLRRHSADLSQQYLALGYSDVAFDFQHDGNRQDDPSATRSQETHDPADSGDVQPDIAAPVYTVQTGLDIRL